MTQRKRTPLSAMQRGEVWCRWKAGQFVARRCGAQELVINSRFPKLAFDGKSVVSSAREALRSTGVQRGKSSLVLAPGHPTDNSSSRNIAEEEQNYVDRQARSSSALYL